VHRDLLYKSHFYLKFDFCKLDDNYWFNICSNY
jgi:hypothetical protein